MGEMIKEVVLSIIGSVGADWFRIVASTIGRVLVAAILPLVGYRIHFRELRRQLRYMPFIYRDMALDPLRDYVELRRALLNPLTLEPASPGTIHSYQIRLKRKTLFLGPPGIGKTTYLRMQVLNLAVAAQTSGDILPSEHLVPFYVPLYAVDATVTTPVLSYILQTNRILRINGARRLLRLAKQHRLFLILDGFDEIALSGPPGSESGFILEELHNIFGRAPAPRGAPSSLIEIYKHLRDCRVWLSSRPDFFRRHRIDDPNEYATLPQTTTTGMAAVELQGIAAHHRLTLVRKIFDWYKEQKRDIEGVLDAELFVNVVDRTLEDELIGLSYNPLFLTVMCYVYANDALKENTPRVPLAGGVTDLVLRCIALLLQEIDQQKVRDRARHRAGAPRPASDLAFVQRRSENATEKLEYLCYAAKEALAAKRPTLDWKFLDHTANDFFSRESTSTEREAILRGLARGDSSANLLRQIIDSGVLVPVGTAALASYDFPHRRFREVLAARWFEPASRLETLADWARDPDTPEFIAFVFLGSGNKDRLLTAILGVAATDADATAPGIAVLACLESDSAYDPSPIVQQFFQRCIAKGTQFVLPERVLDRVRLSREFVRDVVVTLQSDLELETGNVVRIELCCALLARYEVNSLRMMLRQYLRLQRWRPPTGVLVRYAVAYEPEALWSELAKGALSGDGARGLAREVGRITARVGDPAEVVRRVAREGTLRQSVMVLGGVYDNARDRYQSVSERLDGTLEVCAYVFRRIREGWLRGEEVGGIRRFWILTRDTLEGVAEREWKPLLGAVYVGERELEKAAPASVVARAKDKVRRGQLLRLVAACAKEDYRHTTIELFRK